MTHLHQIAVEPMSYQTYTKVCYGIHQTPVTANVVLCTQQHSPSVLHEHLDRKPVSNHASTEAKFFSLQRHLLAAPAHLAQCVVSNL